MCQPPLGSLRHFRQSPPTASRRHGVELLETVDGLIGQPADTPTAWLARMEPLLRRGAAVVLDAQADAESLVDISEKSLERSAQRRAPGDTPPDLPLEPNRTAPATSRHQPIQTSPLLSPARRHRFVSARLIHGGNTARSQYLCRGRGEAWGSHFCGEAAFSSGSFGVQPNHPSSVAITAQSPQASTRST
jgi:hypothetical protein